MRNIAKVFNEFEILDDRLGIPRRASVKNASNGKTGWASHYGGVSELARYANLNLKLPVPFEATWMHGIIEPWRYNRYPLQLLYGFKHDKSRLILVCNDEQKKVLNSIGYTNVHAIGAPYVYAAPEVCPKRLMGSVLVMPPHTIDGAPFLKQSELEGYADYIVHKYGQSRLDIYACIHAACIRNGQWASLFQDRKIPVLSGADPFDNNSLRRMWHIFSLFETLSTPEIGSHVFYALAAGCKVIIEGPEVTRYEAQLLKDGSFRKAIANKENLRKDKGVSSEKLAFIKQFQTENDDFALGRDMVGIEFKRTPTEIRELLGWSLRRQLMFMPQWSIRQFHVYAARLKKLLMTE